jgi:hypothetical protein
MDGFYVYTYLREDGSPYYVGKGKGRRAYDRHHHTIHVPFETTRIHIFPMRDEETAFAYEMYLIDAWGRKDNGTGILRNLSDGGDNPPNRSGRKNTERHNLLIGLANSNQTPKSKENSRRIGYKQGPINVATGQFAAIHHDLTPENCRKGGIASGRQAASTGQIAQARKALRDSGKLGPALAKGRHVRWHVNYGVIKPGCALCQA